MTPTRKVILERTGTAWVASVPSIPPCHTYGTSISQAISRIRRALELWDADPHDVELNLRTSPRLREAIAIAERERRRAVAAADRAADALKAAAVQLTAAGYSRRDAGTLLGISHQRVQQLLDGS